MSEESKQEHNDNLKTTSTGVHLEYSFLPIGKNENKAEKDKLNKKDRIDLLLKILGLASIFISFLVYQNTLRQQQNTLQQQQQLANNQKIKSFQDSISSLQKAITEDQKYKREQIRADSFLRLKQIEVDSSIKQKQLELQQALGNSLEAISFQNKLILEKGRFDNQVALFSETVSNLKTILSSDYNSVEYISAKRNVFDNYYPKIKLQNGQLITNLIDTFQENLQYYEFACQSRIFLDTLISSSIRINGQLFENYFPLTKLDTNYLTFSNNNFAIDIKNLTSQENEFETNAHYFSFLFPKINDFVKANSFNSNNQTLLQLKDVCFDFIKYIWEFDQALRKFIEIKNNHSNEKTFSIIRNNDYNTKLLFKYIEFNNFTDFVLDKNPRHTIMLLTNIFKRNLDKLSQAILSRMTNENPVLKGN